MRALSSQYKCSLRFLNIYFIITYSIFISIAVDGCGKKEDPEIASLRISAEQGSAEAQYNLGLAYANGDGVVNDNAIAFTWYEKAAFQGHKDAQCELARAYRQGSGVTMDIVKAVAWWVLAAQQDDTGDKIDCGVSDLLLTEAEMNQAITYTKEWSKEIMKAAWGGSPSERIQLAGKAYRDIFIEQSGFLPIEVTVTFRDSWGVNKVEGLTFGTAEFRNGQMLVTEDGFSFLDGVECRLDEENIYRFSNNEWIPVSQYETESLNEQFKDLHGQNDRSYKTIKIGNQQWMGSNLDVNTFRNGDTIPEAKTSEEWRNASENHLAAWCYYDNDPKNGEIYGRLYNWYAVNDPRGLAPVGWHIPSYDECMQLINTLGGLEVAGMKIKNADGWFNNEQQNNKNINKSGFSALPGGTREINSGFGSIGTHAFWWSATEFDTNDAGDLGLYSNGFVSRSGGPKSGGYRCVV